jgi:hypothetical protein
MTCPGCGEDHDCGHTPVSECHRSPFMSCPLHFSDTVAAALSAANPSGDGPSAFMLHVAHLNEHGHLTAAWLSWVAIVCEFTVAGGGTVEQALETLGSGEDIAAAAPEGAPDYVRQMAYLSSLAVRSALTHDGANLLAAMETAKSLPHMGMMSFLLSMASSAYLHAALDECTPARFSTILTLGSQLSTAEGAFVLGPLGEMVEGHMTDRTELVRSGFRRLMDLPVQNPGGIALALLGKALGQVIDEDVRMLSTDTDGRGAIGRGPVPPELKDAVLVDIASAEPDNVPDGAMPGIWAIRTGHAYGTAVTGDEAFENVAALVARHGNEAEFVMDVIFAGTQLLAYHFASGEEVTAGQPPG